MEDESVPALLDRAVHLNSALDSLQSEGLLSHYRSALSYLPAPESQHQAMTFFERHSADFDPDRIETTFRRALQENGFRFLPEYNSYLQWLRKTLQPQRCLDLESFELAGLTSLLDPFLVKHDPRHKLLTYVYPRTGLWLKPDLANLTADMQRAASERRLAPTEWRISGFPMLTHYLKQQVWHDLGKTIVFASLAIVFLVLVAFRQPLSATLAGTPQKRLQACGGEPPTGLEEWTPITTISENLAGSM